MRGKPNSTHGTRQGLIFEYVQRCHLNPPCVYLFQCSATLARNTFLFSLTELLFMGQFVSVASCPFAAHFQSTWLYVLCTLSSFFLTLLFPSEQTQLSRCSWSAMHSTPLPVDCRWTHSNVFMSLLN